MKTSNGQNGEVLKLLASASVFLQLIFCYKIEKKLNENLLSKMSFMDFIYAFNEAENKALKDLIGEEIEIRVFSESLLSLSDSLIIVKNKKLKALIREAIERKTVGKYKSLIADLRSVMQIKQKDEKSKKDQEFLDEFDNRRYESIDSELFAKNGFPARCDDLVVNIKGYLDHYGPEFVGKIAREKMLKNLIKIGLRSNDELLISTAFRLTVLDAEVLDEKKKLMYADSSIWFNFGLRGSRIGSRMRNIIFTDIFARAKGRTRYGLCSLILDCKEIFSKSEINFAYDQIRDVSDNFNDWLRVFKEDLSRNNKKKAKDTFIKCISWCLKPDDFKTALEIASERYPHTIGIIEDNLRRVGGSMILFELFRFRLKNFKEIKGEDNFKKYERFHDQVDAVLDEIKSKEVDFKVLSKIHQEMLRDESMVSYSNGMSLAIRSLGEEYMSFIAEQGLKFSRKPKEKK